MNEDRSEHESSRMPDDYEDMRECACCREMDDRQFMRRRQESGHIYCESCYSAIFE